jgi:transposase InsO family protein
MRIYKASTASYGPLGDARIACLVIDECLNKNLFSSLADAKGVLEDWKEDYNHRRPHPWEI